MSDASFERIEIETFHISPLIRITLLSLFIALTLPLPILAKVTNSVVPPELLAMGIVLGAVALFGILSERVETSNRGIAVTYPTWVRWLRRGWSLPWSEVDELSMRTTGQGGLVYYFVTQARNRAYLLPMRIVRFRELLQIVQQNTGIDTSTTRALAQPWMYLALLGCTLLLLIADAWTVLVGVQQMTS
ncbi:MAG: hypothetical protein AAF974_01710 [Cyanobacteria bacterium P01_E01_bin.34]